MERLNALRHVNGLLEGKLKSLFNDKVPPPRLLLLASSSPPRLHLLTPHPCVFPCLQLRESSKATTLQEAVQMLTDEYVQLVDQVRASQASLAAEQRRSSDLEASLAGAQAASRQCVMQRDEAAACVKAVLTELREVDDELVPRLSAHALEYSEMQLRHAELSRREQSGSLSAAQRVQAAEATAARADASRTVNEEEVALLKKRLTQALKRVRELQGTIDDTNARHWIPQGHGAGLGPPPPPRHGRSAPPTPGGRDARLMGAPSPRGSTGTLTMGGMGSNPDSVPPSPSGPTPRGTPRRDSGLLDHGGVDRGVATAADEHPSPRAFTPVAFVS